VGDGVLQPVDVVLAKHMSAAEQVMTNSLGMVPIPDRNYEMGKFELTQLIWRTVMGSNPSIDRCDPSTVACQSDNNPVERVSWNDIQEFLQKLNAMTGKQYRLPTEEEWEYACYGGSQTEYCGGNNLDAVGWYDHNGGNKTHPSGQKQANGYGLYDMTGNVMEWMSDCMVGDCSRRMVRGGSWNDGPKMARASYSNSSHQAAAGHFLLGFRLSRTLP
jgi:formylglycine-generating enzyme required for sulfatase activity